MLVVKAGDSLTDVVSVLWLQMNWAAAPLIALCNQSSTRVTTLWLNYNQYVVFFAVYSCYGKQAYYLPVIVCVGIGSENNPQ